MRKSIMLLFTGGALVFMSFKISEKLENKPFKVYREGDSKIIVWENKGEGDKTWLNYQVEKEYIKNDVVKNSNSFNQKELRDLKIVLDQVIADISTGEK